MAPSHPQNDRPGTPSTNAGDSVVDDLADEIEFDAADPTPVNEDACEECGGRRIRIERMPPPHAAAAWALSGPGRLCFAAKDGSWRLCPSTMYLTRFAPGEEPDRRSIDRRFEHKPAADDFERRKPR